MKALLFALSALVLLTAGVASGYLAARHIDRLAGIESEPAAPATPAGRKILYYRNPMGLPDTSPVPKKDWMGMDYIAVYEGEEEASNSTVKVPLDRVQRSGVRTAEVVRRRLVQPVRAPGTVRIDERRLHVVTLRADAYIEELYVNATGQAVREGQPLFRIYSPGIVEAQVNHQIALNQRSGDGAQRLRNFGVPEAHIRSIKRKGELPMSIDWPSPATGAVLTKNAVTGQRAAAGDELYRIADLSIVWVIADIPERDIGRVRNGDPATVRFRAFPGEEFSGPVTFIAPELMAETRTGQVRIELANTDSRLRAEMLGEVSIDTGARDIERMAVPESAVIDSGTRQVAIVARGEGRFEPRDVRLGQRGEGFVEVLDGLAEGDKVVVSGQFLIDAESNLKSALESLDPTGRGLKPTEASERVGQ